MKTENAPWLFNGQPFIDSDSFVGFVYMITDMTSQKKYIGKKNFTKLRKSTGKRRERSSSDWTNYYGSSAVVKQIVKEKGKANFKREILVLCRQVGSMTWNETKLQFLLKVLESDQFFNDNIGGHYFKERVVRYLSEDVYSETINKG
jgi:hypothetical protein